MSELLKKRCRACEGDVAPLSQDRIGEMLGHVDGWEYQDGQIQKSFSFKNFYQTMAFANVVAWIANQEDHHPDLHVSYKNCIVTYSTHSIGGISENDFICAAKINAAFG